MCGNDAENEPLAVCFDSPRAQENWHAYELNEEGQSVARDAPCQAACNSARRDTSLVMNRPGCRPRRQKETLTMAPRARRGLGGGQPDPVRECRRSERDQARKDRL